VDVHNLPAVNASLNATATCLLLLAYRFIKKRDVENHKRAMLAALAVSTVFLVCYLVYHAQVGSVPFQKQGFIRNVYFFILITHVILAATVPVLAGITVWRAFRRQFDRHRKIARWTFPIWVYVSITGVIVYLMLYQM